MHFPSNLQSIPPDIKLQYQEQEFLFLNCSCFSLRFLAGLLLVVIMGIGGLACLGVDSSFLSAKLLGIILGVGFIGLAGISIKQTLMYLGGRVELQLSQEGGQIQWYWFKIPLGSSQTFYWQELAALPTLTTQKEALLELLKGTQSLFLRSYLSYQQMSYIEELLSYLLESYEKGTLELAPDFGEHLLE